MNYKFKPDSWPATVIDGREYVTYPSAQINTLMAHRDELLAALEECAQDMEGWAAYASSYFQEKHGLAGDVAKYRAIIAKIEGQS